MARLLAVGTRVLITPPALEEYVGLAATIKAIDDSDDVDPYYLRLDNPVGLSNFLFAGPKTVAVLDPMPDPTKTEEVARWLDD